MKFKDLNIIEPILKAIEEKGYEIPSSIQEGAIPPILKGRDLLGCAQTGTGKTAAFAVPILQKLHNKKSDTPKSIKVLILTPTRELAIQIRDNFRDYGKYMDLKSSVIFGGVNQASQVAVLKKGIDILVATPGRLLDLINQKHAKLDNVECLVLDEADSMLDMGFIHDVKRVISHIPTNRQTLLFSATMPAEIKNLAQALLNNPVEVIVNPVASTVDNTKQFVYLVDKKNKGPLLLDILKDKDIESVLIFTRTKHGANNLVKLLDKSNIKCAAIHGNKSQTARQLALNSFKEGSIKVLVATDIAARGIDISGLSHVINYEMPNVPETYVHRIGRTGRAGRDGIALSLCDFDEIAYLKDIEKLIKKTLQVINDHQFPMLIHESTKQVQPQKRSVSNKSTVKAYNPSGSQFNNGSRNNRYSNKNNHSSNMNSSKNFRRTRSK